MIICKYRVKSSDLKKAAEDIADEQSTGTWTEVKGESDTIRERLHANVMDIDAEHSSVQIGYPLELFDSRNLPQLLSVIAGNLFGLSSISGVRLEDIQFPKEYTEEFKGPRFGISGIRELVGTKGNNRPHVGTIIKPKVGLSPKETAEVAYEVALGGIDLIKDDETLTDQKFCPMDDRIPMVMEALDSAREQTGKKVLYAVNITSNEPIEQAERAKSSGANMLMIDVITNGFGALYELSSAELGLPIHVHRTMHAAFTRDPEHGISMLPLAKITRLAGGDQLHIGTVSGKMEGDKEEIVQCSLALKSPNGLKKVFPVGSGGLHPGLVLNELNALGNDLVLQAGGGIHGHPLGSKTGARAMHQAVEAWLLESSLEDYAESHEELKLALDKWS